MQPRSSEILPLTDPHPLPITNKKRKKPSTTKSTKKVKKDNPFTIKLEEFTLKEKKAIFEVRKKISQGHLDLINTFMALSPKQKQLFGDKILYSDEKTYELPFHTAIKNGLPVPIIKAFIDITPLEKIMEKDNKGNTFWHLLFDVTTLPRKKNQLNNLHFLLQWGNEKGIRNLMEPNLSGITPIEKAMKDAIDPVALRLLDVVASFLIASDIQTLFDLACKSKNLKPHCLKKLLTMGATINDSHHSLFESFVKEKKIMGYADKDLQTVINLLHSAGLKIPIHIEYFQSWGNLPAKHLIIKLAFKNLSTTQWALLEETLLKPDETKYNNISYDLIKDCLEVNPKHSILFEKWKNIIIPSISKCSGLILLLVKRGFSLTQWVDKDMQMSLLDYIAFYSNNSALLKYITESCDTMPPNVFHRNLGIQAILGAAHLDNKMRFSWMATQKDNNPEEYHSIEGIHFIKYLGIPDILGWDVYDYAAMIEGIHFIKYLGIPDILGWDVYDYAAMIENTSTRQYIFNHLKRQIENFFRALLSCIETIFPDPLIGLISEYIGMVMKPGRSELAINHYQLTSDEEASRLALQWAQSFIQKGDLLGTDIQERLIDPLKKCLNSESELHETRKVFLHFNDLTFLDNSQNQYNDNLANSPLSSPEKIKKQFTLLTKTPLNPTYLTSHHKTYKKEIKQGKEVTESSTAWASLPSNPLHRFISKESLRPPSKPNRQEASFIPHKGKALPITSHKDKALPITPHENKTLPITNALSMSIFSSPIDFPCQLRKRELLKWVENLSSSITSFTSLLRPYRDRIIKIHDTQELDILINDMSTTFYDPRTPLHQMAKSYGEQAMLAFGQLFYKQTLHRWNECPKTIAPVVNSSK